MYNDNYKSILSSNNGMNIYRGCDHGCIYCDSRSECYNINHNFEEIEVKKDAFSRLDSELAYKKDPVMIGTGSMSDPYNKLNRELKYTRKCLEVIYKRHCGISILTKSTDILEDLDLLVKINQRAKTVVQMTLTTADDELCKIVEPNVSVTSERVKALETFYENGIKTIVWLCPLLPGINDTKENLLALLDMCEKAHVYGIICFGIGLTLRKGNREYYYNKLDEHFPSLKDKYIKLYGEAYEIASPNSRVLYNLLKDECKKRNIILDNEFLFNYLKTYPVRQEQLSLF